MVVFPRRRFCTTKRDGKKPSAAKKVPRDGKQNGKKLSEKVFAARKKKNLPKARAAAGMKARKAFHFYF